MFIVEINQNDMKVKERSGVSAKTGKNYNIREQPAYISTGGIYPVAFKINLEDGQPPYPAGKYTLHPSSVEVNGYGRLSFGRILLEQIK